MTMLADDPQLMAKTKELCELIAGSPEFKGLYDKVMRFMADDGAKQKYQSVQEKVQALHQKQQAGLELSASEVEAYQAAESDLLANPVASDFLQAQESLQSVQMVVGKYVSMTLELGRVPSDDDMQDQGCCNEGG